MLDQLKWRVKGLVLARGLSIERHNRDAAAALLRRMWPIAIPQPLVRFGGDTDGAYLMPDDLEGIAAVYSPGVSTVATFEEEMAARGLPCYLADASVPGPPTPNALFHFTPKFLGISDVDDFMSIDSWVNADNPGSSDLLLQMDIEGAEWDVLASISPQLLGRFRIMVIEFHRLEFLMHSQLHRNILERILLTHRVVHSHANNVSLLAKSAALEMPQFLEITFWRNDRVEPDGYATQFPHPLDILNVPDRPPVVLPACWHAPTP